MKSNLLFLFSILSFVLLSSSSYADESCSAGFYREINSSKYRELQTAFHSCRITTWLSDDKFDVCCSKPVEAPAQPPPPNKPEPTQQQSNVGSGGAGSSAKRPSQSRKAPRQESSEGSHGNDSPGDSSVLRDKGYQPGKFESGNQAQTQTPAGTTDKLQCNNAYPTLAKHFATEAEGESFHSANMGNCIVNGGKDGYVGCCIAGYNPKDGGKGESPECNEAAQEMQTCIKDRETADSRCDPESGNLGVWIKGMKAGNMFGTQAMGMTMGIQGVCEKAAGLMTGLNTALAAFQGVCESGRNSCMSSCQSVIKKMRSCPVEIYPDLVNSKPDMEKNLSDCRGYGSRLNESAQSVNMAMSSFQQAQQCAALTKTMNMTVCTQNPFAPGCAGANQTCDNPTFAATNPVCIGLRNPGGSATTQVALPTPGGSGGLPDLKSSGGFTGENIGAGLDGMDGALAGGGPGGPGAPVGEDPGGKKGSGAPLNPNSGGGQGGGGAGGGGGGYDQEKIQVYGGTYGSGGGAGAFGAGRGGGYGTNVVGNRYPGNASGGTAFSKFNPAMAGMSRSGLTGANGASIWQKVSNRYKAKEHSMKGVTP